MLEQHLKSKHAKPVKMNTTAHKLMQPSLSMMYGQPKNVNHARLHLESFTSVMATWQDVLTERANALNFVLEEGLMAIKEKFKFNPIVLNKINYIPYTVLAKVMLPNIIGLKCSIRDYTDKLDEALAVSADILYKELPALTTVVAQLLEKDALINFSPVKGIASLRVELNETSKIREELGKMISNDHTKDMVSFGETYYSVKDFKDVNSKIAHMGQALKKLDIPKKAKELQNLTNLLDKLIIRSRNVEIPRDNVATYASIIESASNNVAFTGAIISMTQVLINVVEQHNEIVEREVDDYKEHKK